MASREVLNAIVSRTARPRKNDDQYTSSARQEALEDMPEGRHGGAGKILIFDLPSRIFAANISGVSLAFSAIAPVNAPLVTIKNGATVTNSRDVAAYFGKTHHTVLEAVDTLIEAEPSIARNFLAIEIETKVGFGIRKDRAFDMSRDGFTLLAMGFTGKKALASPDEHLRQFRPDPCQRLEVLQVLGDDRKAVGAGRGCDDGVCQVRVIGPCGIGHHADDTGHYGVHGKDTVPEHIDQPGEPFIQPSGPLSGPLAVKLPETRFYLSHGHGGKIEGARFSLLVEPCHHLGRRWGFLAGGQTGNDIGVEKVTVQRSTSLSFEGLRSGLSSIPGKDRRKSPKLAMGFSMAFRAASAASTETRTAAGFPWRVTVMKPPLAASSTRPENPALASAMLMVVGMVTASLK